MTNERQTILRLSSVERFRAQVEAIPSAPKGYKYEDLFGGQPVLIPEARNEPIVEGTNHTARQLGSITEVFFAKGVLIDSYFPVYLRERDKLIRSGRVDELIQRLEIIERDEKK